MLVVHKHVWNRVSCAEICDSAGKQRQHKASCCQRAEQSASCGEKQSNNPIPTGKKESDQPLQVAKAQAMLGGVKAAAEVGSSRMRAERRVPLVPAPAKGLLPDSLGFSAVMRLASTSTGWAERHAGLNVHVWPPKATRRSPSPYTLSTFPTWPSTWGE